MKRVLRGAATLMLVAGAPSLAAASPRECSPRAVYEEIVSDEARSVSRVGAIPREVLTAFGIRDAAGIADPGEPWNAGCVQRPPLPGIALLFAARAGRTWLLYTRHGGFAVVESLRVLCRDEEGLSLFAVTPPREEGHAPSFASLAHLQRALRPEWIRPDGRPAAVEPGP